MKICSFETPTSSNKRKMSWLFKFEVQDQGDGNDKNGNNTANNPLVPAHPPCHGSQNSLAFPYVVIHPMKLQ